MKKYFYSFFSIILFLGVIYFGTGFYLAHTILGIDHSCGVHEGSLPNTWSTKVDYQDIKRQVNGECKLVPSTPDMSKIVQALSLEVDGQRVLDQSFTAGNTSMKPTNEGFSVQPLAVTLHADFDSIFSIIKNVESMNRLVRVASIRMTRKESEADASAPALEAAIGLHAMYDTVEAD